MRLAVMLAGALAVGCSAPASAVAPTEDQVQRLQQMLGFDVAIQRWTTGQLDLPELFPAMEPEQRDCVVAQTGPAFERAFTDAFKEVFGDQETAAVWLDFANTSSGSKLMSFVQASVIAGLEGTQAPTLESSLADMTSQEAMQMMQFMSSPAAQVLQRSFPDVQMSEEDVEALAQQAMRHCGIDNAGA